MYSMFPHSAISALAFFQSTQLNLFERFLNQAVSGIDSTSITSGMQTVAYVVLLVGFLWQVYGSAMHGGDVRGLGTNLIKYVATATVVMNYHAVFTTINQGFVDASNWISNASGAMNLFENWKSDLLSQFSQVGFQNLWGLITASVPGLIDGILILIAYILFPVVIVIFGFFYILFGSILYIFGPVVVALMPLGAANRLAKSYVEQVFIWNTWPILYAGFGSLLSAIQMGQIGQMLNQNDFLGALGNLEGSVLIGIASIIYSIAIAVIPFIARRIVSGEVGSTAVALMGAAATALTTGIAAGEGVVAGVATARTGAATGATSGSTASSGSAAARTTSTTTGAVANQPAPQQRSAQATSTVASSSSRPSTRMGGTNASSQSQGLSAQEVIADQHAEKIRTAMGGPSRQSSSAASEAPTEHSAAANVAAGVAPTQQKSAPRSQSTRSSSHQRPSVHPYGLATWGAYHAARIATAKAIRTGSFLKSAAQSAREKASQD